MPQKPIGAAFSRARATGKDQSRAAQRRRANQWLKDNGHSPMSRKVAKGILDRWRAMTTDERADQFNLQASGISPEVARALAMQGNGKLPKRRGAFGSRTQKSDGDDMTPPRGVRAACRRGLQQMTEHGGPGLTAGAKARARRMASGKPISVAQARRIAAFHARHGAQGGSLTDDKGRPTPKAVALNLWGGKAGASWAKKMVGRSEQVDKMGPTLAEVHAPAPLGGNAARRRKLPMGTINVDEIIKEAYAQVAKGGPGSGPRPGGGAGSFGGKITDHQGKQADSHLAAAARHIARAREARAAGDHANAAKHTEIAHERMTQARAASVGRLQKSRVEKRHMVAQLANQIVQAAYATPQMPGPTGGFEDRPDCAQYLDAQRLVAGMDQETIANADTTPVIARARASGALATNMGAYDRIVAGPDRTIAGVGGLNLDLGSGQARERGFLGVDLYPYDYGTVIHDLGLGIPFPDGSARAVRLINALADMPDYADNPTELLREVQRVLAIGGRFYYQGAPIQDSVDWDELPGLGVVSHRFDSGGTLLSLTLARVPAKLPLVYGADVNHLAVDERFPEDLALSQATFGAVPNASVAMANLVHKREHVEVKARVLKKEDWQHVVLGVVLCPSIPDSQGDVMDAADIEETAHNFLANARVVGKEHGEVWEGGEVVESYIAPMNMSFNDPAYGPQEVPKGSWILAVRLPEEGWHSVLDGSFTGFSVGGWGEREEVTL